MSISKLNIENFKSVEKLDINPSRINVFIGGPNSGKTNIIEALSTHSIGFPNHHKEYIRFNKASELFTDSDVTKTIKIETNQLSCEIGLAKNDFGALLNSFNVTHRTLGNQEKIETTDALHYDGKLELLTGKTKIFSTRIARYIFKHAPYETQQSFSPFLNVPYGDNIPNLIFTNSKLKKIAADIFSAFGLKILTEKDGNKILLVRVEDDTFVSLEYPNLSSTLQRIVFMLFAMQSNTNMALLFDEPEANIYPFYSQRVANYMASDESNQYFFTSHSPYLINRLIDETPQEDLSIFYTEMKNFRTTVRKLTTEEAVRFASMGEDAMLNLENIVG